VKVSVSMKFNLTDRQTHKQTNKQTNKQTRCVKWRTVCNLKCH